MTMYIYYKLIAPISRFPISARPLLDASKELILLSSGCGVGVGSLTQTQIPRLNRARKRGVDYARQQNRQQQTQEVLHGHKVSDTRRLDNFIVPSSTYKKAPTEWPGFFSKRRQH